MRNPTPKVDDGLPAGALLFSLLFVFSSHAQDSTESELDWVEYVSVANKGDPWNETPVDQLRGRVQEFDAESLVLLQSDAAQRSIPSSHIVRIVPHWRTEAARSAHQLFLDKKYRDVVATVPEALKSGLIQWQQRILISELVQSIDALGNPRLAGIFFLNLVKSKPPPLLYADMPLCWTTSEPDKALQEQALEWLNSSDEAARLLGASWLLFGERQVQAARTITQLQAADNETLAQLSVAQSWRLIPPPETKGRLTQWLQFRDKLPSPLQLGPTELIADRLMRIGEPELAIGQWLRIASLHGEQYHRASVALESAAAQLKRLGREEEAKRLEPWITELRGELPAE